MTSSLERTNTNDTEEYRTGYPGKKEHENLDANARFYMNQMEFKPNGALIEEILKNWWGDYKLLERHHDYIQWLFPMREKGANWYAQELQLHEIEKICENEEAYARVLRAYKMMLDLYGMELEDDKSGKIRRAENWEERFQHLNKSTHNYLRITRILKCLGELKYEHLKRPFIEFILHEAMVEETLPNLLSGCCNYWIDVLRGDGDREEMWKLYETLSEQSNQSSDDEKNENSNNLKMKDKSENELKYANLNEFENEKVKEREESAQEDGIEQSNQVYEADVLMEEDNEKNKSSEKSNMMDESENDLESVNLETSGNEKVKEEEEESTQENNIEESTLVFHKDVLMHTENESSKKLKMKDESENDLESVNLETSANEKVKEEEEESTQENNIEESTQVFHPDVLMHTENESSKKLKMKDESENELVFANLKESADEKVQVREEFKGEDNIEELPYVFDQDVRI